MKNIVTNLCVTTVTTVPTVTTVTTVTVNTFTVSFVTVTTVTLSTVTVTTVTVTTVTATFLSESAQCTPLLAGSYSVLHCLTVILLIAHSWLLITNCSLLAYTYWLLKAGLS